MRVEEVINKFVSQLKSLGNPPLKSKAQRQSVVIHLALVNAILYTEYQEGDNRVAYEGQMSVKETIRNMIDDYQQSQSQDGDDIFNNVSTLFTINFQRLIAIKLEKQCLLLLLQPTQQQYVQGLLDGLTQTEKQRLEKVVDSFGSPSIHTAIKAVWQAPPKQTNNRTKQQERDQSPVREVRVNQPRAFFTPVVDTSLSPTKAMRAEVLADLEAVDNPFLIPGHS